MASYKGMRWWKCDLQMQTPLSPHWREDETRLAQADSDERKKEVARLYLQRCHDVGLQVIAITDHNFAPDANSSFIPYLINENRAVAEALGRAMIHILPGFEIEAHVGAGSHVLALFDRDTPLNVVDSKLSNLSLNVGARYAGTRPLPTRQDLPNILNTIQNDEDVPGLVIAAHPQDTGIFDNDRVAVWLQQDEYKNTELLALEIPRPLEQLTPGWQRLLKNGADCHGEWKRVRQIACVMSSDCYRLNAREEDPSNFIGCRYSWIKMSTPTIRAMRQAFLDPSARVAFGEKSPDELRRHGLIKSIAVQNADYLADQTVILAQGLTCFIGGRGTGKSTFLEYARLALNQEQDIQSGTNAASQVKRAKETLNPESTIQLEWLSPGGTEDIFVRQGSEDQSEVVGREVLDPETVFKTLGVQLFSQRQINDAGQTNRIFEVIETILGPEIRTAIDAEEPVRSSLRILFEKEELLREAQSRSRRVTQEIADLQRQLDARASVSNEAEQYRFANEIETYLDDAEAIIQDIEERIAGVAEEVDDCFINMPEINNDWPNVELVKGVSTQLLGFSTDITNDVRGLSQRVSQRKEQILQEGTEVVQLKALLERKKGEFLQACEDQGIAPQDVAQIKEIDEEIRRKVQAREEMRREIERFEGETNELSTQIDALEECWRNQTVIRKREIQVLVDSVNEAARETSGQQRLLDFEVVFQGQTSDFHSRFWNIAPDGRSTLGKRWGDLGDALHAAFVAQTEIGRLWRFVNLWMTGEGGQIESLVEFEPLRKDLVAHLVSSRLADWKERRIMRVADFVDFSLYRQDRGGREEIAGRLSEGKLSDGQRNTVVLALLLVRSNSPIFIDQPEDDIDSDFIFKYLVPVLRDRKDQRQIVLVTHNPNIVVNGDADLVYALEFSEGQGRLRAQGGLDLENVHDAVLDIMEGSFDAFRKRREKYGF